MKYIVIFILSLHSVFALIITPEDALTNTFHADTVIKKSKILTKKQHADVQKLSKIKLSSKLYRVYIAKKNELTVGLGILLTQKVRSKSTAVLYMLKPTGELEAIEIIAFNEPKEYSPSPRWMKQFEKNPAENFKLKGGSINSISGATLSANAVIRVANLAHAIWKVALQK